MLKKYLTLINSMVCGEKVMPAVQVKIDSIHKNYAYFLAWSRKMWRAASFRLGRISSLLELKMAKADREAALKRASRLVRPALPPPEGGGKEEPAETGLTKYKQI